ncbi:hypothetical protein E5D57_009610 [Metarhizium anisopliae]|nr:hypothetical protein E5D57_009610 [Metarhizium anisopliae]
MQNHETIIAACNPVSPRLESHVELFCGAEKFLFSEYGTSGEQKCLVDEITPHIMVGKKEEKLW